MSQAEVLDVFKHALMIIFTLSSPLLFVSIGIGFLVSVFQAATQINEQTMTFVPKVLAIGAILFVSGSWMLTHLSEFFNYLIDIMIRL